MPYKTLMLLVAGVMGMYAKKDMDMRFNTPMQTATGSSGYTMKSDGFADTMLMAKYLLHADDPLIPTSQFSLFAGLSLPTGSITERNAEHPLAMRKRELLPYGMQLGSGTWDPTLGLLYQGSSSPLWYDAYQCAWQTSAVRVPLPPPQYLILS